ncbi:hypothetical protein [Acidiphilium multivorum]|uniref:hypothetical protein n=1 Tax=Acidiphilium multivorum TaxID=62140 RepID=UPI001F4BE87C|nr:hypothetical protein [Acidiphilium multivorum]
MSTDIFYDIYNIEIKNYFIKKYINQNIPDSNFNNFYNNITLIDSDIMTNELNTLSLLLNSRESSKYVNFPSNNINKINTSPTRDEMATIYYTLLISSEIYHNLFFNCKSIFENINVDDVDGRDLAVEKLYDIFIPFRRVIVPIFQGFIGTYNENAEITSFLLNHLLMSLDFIDSRERLEIIEISLESQNASVRMAAIEALDRLDTSDAKRIMAAIYPSESRLGRKLIEANLSAG